MRGLTSFDRPSFRVDFDAMAVDVDPPATFGELRASLAICDLTVATVVRCERLQAEPAHLLRRVIDELEADIDFLWELEPDEERPTLCRQHAPPPDDLLVLIERIFAYGNLLSRAIQMVGTEAQHARRLDAAVTELGDTARATWSDIPTGNDDGPHD